MLVYCIKPLTLASGHVTWLARTNVSFVKSSSILSLSYICHTQDSNQELYSILTMHMICFISVAKYRRSGTFGVH